MTLRSAIKTFAISALFALAAEPVLGQDLLARQAPIDRRAKKLDSIEVSHFAEKENLQSPAAKLYGDEWDNRYAHRATELPDSFVINLRHFCMPTPSRVVTSNFGSRWGRMHKGLDIKVYIGDTIRAAFSGKVRIVRYEAGGYGNYVVIRHPNGLETIYGHLSKQLVSENQQVRAGEPIGLGGNTGRSTGSHLHFETRLCGVALNPALMFDFRWRIQQRASQWRICRQRQRRAYLLQSGQGRLPGVHCREEQYLCRSALPPQWLPQDSARAPRHDRQMRISI